jgi:YD repeat-containing protein
VWTYDNLGQLVAIESSTKSPSADHVTTRITEVRYNAAGSISSIVHTGGEEWRYIYSDLGQLAMVIKPGGARIVYQYDSLGRLASRSEASVRHEQFTYYPDSKLKTRKLVVVNGITTDYVYNESGRIVSETYSNNVRPKTFKYDSVGRLVQVKYPDGTDTIYTYDLNDRIVTIRGNNQAEVDYQYSDDGKRIAIPVKVSNQESTSENHAGILK